MSRYLRYLWHGFVKDECTKDCLEAISKERTPWRDQNVSARERTDRSLQETRTDFPLPPTPRSEHMNPSQAIAFVSVVRCVGLYYIALAITTWNELDQSTILMRAMTRW